MLLIREGEDIKKRYFVALRLPVNMFVGGASFSVFERFSFRMR